MRVKGMRHRIKSINSGMRNVLAERGIDPGDVIPEMKESDVKRESLANVQMAREFAKYFYDKAWILQRAPESTPLFASDNPVTLHNLIKRRRLGLNSSGVEIYLPISRQFSICFLCRSMGRGTEWKAVSEISSV